MGFFFPCILILQFKRNKKTSFHFQPNNYTVQANFIRAPNSSLVIDVGMAEVLILLSWLCKPLIGRITNYTLTIQRGMNILLDTTSNSQTKRYQVVTMYKSLNNKGYGLVQLTQIRLRLFTKLSQIRLQYFTKVLDYRLTPDN